jgi:anti-sigma factor RsiW
VDGELDALTRREVEAWLAQHPEGAAEVEAHARLMQMWRATQPTEPLDAAWEAALAKIETALSTGPTPASQAQPSASASNRPLWVGWCVRLTGAAAAIWLLGVLEPFERPDASRDAGVEPLPVAVAQDVEIISVNAGDAAMLVVGELPLRDPLDLATTGDVTIHSVQPDVDGMVPQVVGQDDTATVPMIVAPLVVAQTSPRGKP